MFLKKLGEAKHHGETKQVESEMEQLFIDYKKKYLQVTCQEKLNCSFDSWYKQFRKQTIKSRIIPINKTFIDYLKKDGLKLPPQIQNEMDNYYELDSDNDSGYDNDPNFKDENENDGDSKSNQQEQNDDNDIDYTQMDELFAKIREKISALKDAVIPKLNWSAPKDAKWINGETLKCENITQILLLLKSSQFVQHDLFYPFHGCCDYEIASTSNTDKSKDKDEKTNFEFEYKLILRKYSNLHPNREFRCFIYNKKILAITQRNDDDYFEELQSEKARDKLSECINEFFESFVMNEFMNDKYVMDVYVDKEYKVYIIDFNPFYEFTDCGVSLTWIDICKLIKHHGDKKKKIMLGYVDKTETAKIKFNSKSQYRYPIDAVDLSDERHINQFVEPCQNNQ